MWKDNKILDINDLDEGQERNNQYCEWEEMNWLGLICVWDLAGDTNQKTQCQCADLEKAEINNETKQNKKT